MIGINLLRHWKGTQQEHKGTQQEHKGTQQEHKGTQQEHKGEALKYLNSYDCKKDINLKLTR